MGVYVSRRSQRNNVENESKSEVKREIFQFHVFLQNVRYAHTKVDFSPYYGHWFELTTQF